MAIVLVNHGAAAFLRHVADTGEEFDLRSFLKASGAVTDAERQRVKHLYSKLVRKDFVVPTGGNKEGKGYARGGS